MCRFPIHGIVLMKVIISQFILDNSNCVLLRQQLQHLSGGFREPTDFYSGPTSNSFVVFDVSLSFRRSQLDFCICHNFFVFLAMLVIRFSHWIVISDAYQFGILDTGDGHDGAKGERQLIDSLRNVTPPNTCVGPFPKISISRNHAQVLFRKLSTKYQHYEVD